MSGQGTVQPNNREPSLKEEDDDEEESSSDSNDVIIDEDVEALQAADDDDGNEPSDPDHQLILNPNDQEKLGSLLSMQLINFMCHDNFEIKFGPNVNFVIGRNGSGKSAIMTALVLCLGGRATNTNRGQSVYSFIKKGKDFAKIIVRICNFNGSPAYSYSYDEYGDTIIVERIITKTLAADQSKSDPTNPKKKSSGPKATSSYYVKNGTTGKAISFKKEDVDKITNYFSIQIDNPVVLLNQETSRNFLNSKNPKDKYKFFLRATNLHTLKMQLLRTREEFQKATRTKDDKTTLLPEVEHEVKELGIKVKRLMSVSKWKQDIQVAKHQLVWSEVAAKEGILDSKKKVLETEKKKLEELAQAIQAHDSEKQKLNDELKKLEDEAKKFSSRTSEINGKMQEVEEACSSIRREKEQKSLEIRTQKNKMREIKDSIKEFEDAIADVLKKRGDHDKLQKEKQMRQEKKTRLESRLKEIDQQLKTQTQFVQEKKCEAGSVASEVEKLRTELFHLKKTNSHLTQNINDVRGVSRGNDLSKFGPEFPQINQRIEAAVRSGKFKVKPVGPLGQYIKLTDMSCSHALQACLKGLLRTYVCDNFDDTNELTNILRQVCRGRQPQIITRKFRSEKFNVEENKVRDDQHKSFVDLINVTDPNAFNVIIDNSHLESVAYIPRSEEAMTLLLNKRTVPVNCQMAYSKDGTQFYPTTNDKPFRRYPNEHNLGTNLFSQDMSADIEKYQQQIQTNNLSIQQVEDELKEKEKKRHDCLQSVPAREESIRKLKNERLVVVRDLDDLNNHVEHEPVQVTSLEDERNDKQQELHREEEQLEVRQQKLAEMQERLESRQGEKRELEAEKSNIANEARNFDGNKKEIQEKLRQLDTSRTIKLREEQKVKVEEVTKEVESVNFELDVMIEAASQESGGERVQCSKTVDQLKAEIRQKMKLIQESEKEVGEVDVINEAYKQAKAKLEATKLQLSNVELNIKNYGIAFSHRRTLFHERRNKVTRIMQIEFQRCLKQLGFEGVMDIKHANTRTEPDGQIVRLDPTLTLRVSPRSTESGGHMYKDTRSLSGGERSFSTVAFLLALWQGCPSPFKILDEVDVFMDMVTRQIAMDSLVQAAKESGKQYVFLSPLPLISEFVNNPLIVIHRMTEPGGVNPGPSHPADQMDTDDTMSDSD